MHHSNKNSVNIVLNKELYSCWEVRTRDAGWNYTYSTELICIIQASYVIQNCCIFSTKSQKENEEKSDKRKRYIWKTHWKVLEMSNGSAWKKEERECVWTSIWILLDKISKWVKDVNSLLKFGEIKAG